MIALILAALVLTTAAFYTVNFNPVAWFWRKTMEVFRAIGGRG